MLTYNDIQVQHMFGFAEVEDLPLLGGGAHSGPVTSLDMAVQRPIVVSACSNLVKPRCSHEFVGQFLGYLSNFGTFAGICKFFFC